MKHDDRKEIGIGIFRKHTEGMIEEIQKEAERRVLQDLYDYCFALRDPDDESKGSNGSISAAYILWYATVRDIELDDE